ncbi:MAG: DUF4340 domain-containing protein [candidate division KSB1 bacterium]|nr:DUF4340 domain-containing protein [candidate division KSB1 bacterium]MDZ7303485.1 DUF4340 domain-containing protein [candidate division KSB1 bacterium]MDZ7312713.1 DUF4340 domain-containing protein [candidate division KSB1 bacterium]
MKVRNTLILLVLAALAVVYLIYERKSEEKASKEREAAKKFLLFKKDSVSTIMVKPDGIEVRKIGGTWQLQAPVQYKADENTVNALLNVLEMAVRDRTDITRTRSEYPTFGLDPARREIILQHEGRQDTIYVGDQNTTGTLVYARINSDPEVVMTGIGVHNNVNKALLDWRDKDLINFETSAVNRLLLKTPKNRFELKKEGGKWQMVVPMKTAADDSKVSSILNRVRYGRVSEFAAEQLDDGRKYGLDQPAYEVTVFFGANDAQKTVQFGRKEGAFNYAHDPARPQVFRVDTSLVKDLNVSVMDLRNKKLAEFESWNVDYVELNYADTLKIICEKDTSNNWQITAPQPRKAKNWKVSNITGNLSSLEAVAFADENARDLAKFGLDKPRAILTVKQKGNEVARVLIGRQNQKGDRVYAKAANSPMVAEVKKDDADRLFTNLSELAE